MSHEPRPKGVHASEWPVPAPGPRRERPPLSAEASTNYFSVTQSFVVGFRHFAKKGELVPASDPVAAKVARAHPELLHLIYPERNARKDS
jgi:hypothetical protein